MELAKVCDDGWKSMTEAMDGTPYSAYSVVVRERDRCRLAMSGMSRISFSGVAKREARKALDETMEQCQMAYTMRIAAMDTALKILNGDTRPSQMHEFQSNSEAGQSGQLSCVAGFFAAADKAGISMDEMGKIQERL